MLLFLDLKIEVRFIREGENDELNITISILKGLLKYKTTIPFIDFLNNGRNIITANIYKKAKVSNTNAIEDEKEEKEFNYDEIKIIIKKGHYYYKKYCEVLHYIHKRITINKVLWKTNIGLEDAADTAIISGILWGIKSNLMTLLKRKLRPQRIYIDVVPCYVSKKFGVIFDCIVTLKIGYIIIAGIKLLSTKIKGGENIE
ncbi:DUF2953 domain-containing protein [Clostridium aceticum]|uniref:DUF2953 domain-containing protein n=1 Tax=Clostridium aceticum TaxID=84022 RepID=UPI0005CE9A1A|nr:DUF2953 domain-containing protein [Clostridium aceticum]KJF28171.1 hypothetical protein TZ02_06440 [Clostridium aceticum]